MDFVELEIINWSRYNPRKDFKRPSWFALNNRLLEDPMFSEFSDGELIAWVYILCQASQKNSSMVRIFYKHAAQFRIKKSVLQSAMTKLEIVQSIRIHVQNPNSTLHNTTLHNTTIHMLDSVESAKEFDFGSIYEKYPRKEGKARGLKICETQIKTDKEFSELGSAVAKYCEHIKTNGVEARYIKHFSSFMACWRDFLDENFGTTSGDKRKKTILEILQEA